MRLQTLIKLVAAIIVLSVVAITLFVVSKHFGLTVDSVPSNLLGADQINKLGSSSSDELVVIDSLRKKLTSKNTPEIVLGNPAFEKAREMLEQGKYDDARLKLAEREAYRVLGEMRLDDLLEHRPDDGKFIYTVKRGDSFIKIVNQFDTNLDILLYLNGLTRIDRLQPNDKLIIMPLDLSLRIVPRLNQLFLLDKNGDVVKSYEPVVDMKFPKMLDEAEVLKTTVEDVRAYRGKTRINITLDDYREASKKIVILSPNIEIISEDIEVDDSFRGIILSKADVEELALLLKSSNTVEIHY
jgi:hypothetical protein